MKQPNIKDMESAITREHGNIAGVVVSQNGETVYENYFNSYAAADSLHVYSVTKSIFSALVGIAIEQGLIEGVHQKVLDFFPEYPVPESETTIRQVTLAHLLTMTAPYKYTAEPYEAFFASENWVKAALDLLGGPALTGEFRYTAVTGAHILSGILARATGRPIQEYAAEYLFAPLGIDVGPNVELRSREEHMAFGGAKTTRGWVVDPQGLNTASWGLSLTPGDMAKIGRLYLNRGVWNGRQVVPAGWVEESTRQHSRWGQLAYGYLWWVMDGPQHAYAAMGDGGNVIYVNPQKQLVVAIAAAFAPDAGDRIELITEYIEPLFAGR